MPAALSANAVELRIEQRVLLSDINLSIGAGEVLAVLGPNGAGKTSLLRLLSGELSAQRGSVTLNGRPLAAWADRARAQMLAVLPQQSLLGFPFRVLEVVLLGRIPHDSGRQLDEQIAYAALDAADARHLSERDYTRLSGGEKQRVHLARVLAQIWQPAATGERFLLLDEPTSALDLAHQHAILRAARQLAAQGVGVLLILHDLNLAAQYADRIVMLGNGRMVAQGSPADVMTEAMIQQLFAIEVSVLAHPQNGRPLIINKY